VLVFGAILVVLLVMGYLTLVAPGNALADYGAMKRHVLTRLTDADLRRMHEQAVADFEVEKAEAAQRGRDFWKEKGAVLKRCEEDAAFRTRNSHECSLPIGVYSIGKPYAGRSSVEELYESLIMGICRFELTVREAREFKCLP
jgi:hypothetical protein